MRNELYAHLQRLPVSFHDQWQSGQLLSRATTDLSTIRRFVGFGLVFLLVNSVTYLLVVALLINLYWPLAVLVGVAALPVLELSRRFERNYMAVSRRLQDQNGDLTTLVEEAATGIRVTKAFGRAPLQNRQFAAQAGRLHGTGMQRVRLLGRVLGRHRAGAQPDAGRGPAGRRPGRRPPRPDASAALVAFVVPRAARWRGRSTPWVGSSERPRRPRRRPPGSSRCSTSPPPSPTGPAPSTLARAEGRLRFERVRFAYPGTRAPVLDGVDLELAPGETVALVGATGSGKTSLALAGAPAVRRHRRPGDRSTATTSGT